MNGCASDKVAAHFIDLVADDLNTPAALNWLFARRSDRGISPESFRASYEMLGLKVWPMKMEVSMDQLIRSRVERRSAMIREKNWSEADRIREDLLSRGIQLKDGKDPVTGERITTWEVKR